MYEKNYEVLSGIVRDKSVIVPVSQHRKADGTFDLEKNKKAWNAALAKLEQIPLWKDGTPGYEAEKDPLQPEPSLVFVPARNAGEARGTILVAHGGGFQSRTGCEGMHVAHHFVDRGFNAAVLTYRLAPYTRFDAIRDMQRAIRLLRSEKEELGITDRIAVMGFSAGGMLSGNCATHFDLGKENAEDRIERVSSRPDAAVIAYGSFAFASFPQGMMRSPFQEEKRGEEFYLAPELNVSPDCPPFFIWQTISDDPRHSFALGSALTAAGVPFEMHCFPDGVHGLGLADGNNDLGMNLPHVGHWAELCAEWLWGLGI